MLKGPWTDDDFPDHEIDWGQDDGEPRDDPDADWRKENDDDPPDWLDEKDYEQDGDADEKNS